MTIEQLREYHAARPFQPFTLNLVDGRRVAISHPEYMAQSPGGRIIHVATGQHTIESIDLLHVVSIERDLRSQSGTRNGPTSS